MAKLLAGGEVEETETTRIKVHCPACGAPYLVQESMLGGHVSCRQCGQRFELARALESSPAASTQTTTPVDPSALALGQLAVRLRLLTPAELEQGLSLMAERPDHNLGEVLVEAGLLSPQKLEFLRSAQQMKEERISDHRFGRIVVGEGFATDAQVEQAMAEQKARFLKLRESIRIGELMVAQGTLTTAQRDVAVEIQQRQQEEHHEKAPALLDQPELKVQLSEDHLAASVTLPAGSTVPDRHEVEGALRRARVVFGIDQEAIARLCSEPPTGEPVLVAQGRAPVRGSDAQFEYAFATTPLTAGRESEDGKIDFRDRGSVPIVNAGDLLVSKTPSQPGTPGTDVLGKPLGAPAGKDRPLRAGKGAKLAPDRLSVIADAEGYPSVSGTGVVSVFPEYRIDGDVGYKTGHVDFHGRVVVTGAIQNGFKVHCGELVVGEIQEAEVEVEGDVQVSGGVIGARIRTGGSFKAHYLQHTQLNAMGDILVIREVIDSTIECRGAFRGEKARILGSEVSAYKGIHAGDIGSESSRPCHLTVGVDESLHHELERLEQVVAGHHRTMAEFEEALQQSDTRNAELSNLIGEQAQIQDRAMVRIRELEQQGAASSNEMTELKQQAEEAERNLNALFDEQDRLNTLVDNAPAQRQQIQEELLAAEEEMHELKSWAEQDPGAAVVKTTGTLRRQTLVRTPHTEGRLGNDHKRAHFEEREYEGESGEREWRLVPVR